ncbi:MAG TPA: hypothetical protein VFE62_13720 [Gemmataceae bacterium]|nr:hypothetical protein [Gemmataceae bacterium]
MHDLRESKVWKEAHDLGRVEAKHEFIRNALAKGMPHKEIAELVALPVSEVQRLAKQNEN